MMVFCANGPLHICALMIPGLPSSDEASARASLENFRRLVPGSRSPGITEWRTCCNKSHSGPGVRTPVGAFRSFRSVSSHGNLLIVARRGRLAVVGWLEAPGAGAWTRGPASARLGLRRVRRPCRLNPGGRGGGPARRGGTGSLRASAAAVYCRTGDGETGRSGRIL